MEKINEQTKKKDEFSKNKQKNESEVIKNGIS
jgi:hypothetical protein